MNESEEVYKIHMYKTKNKSCQKCRESFCRKFETFPNSSLEWQLVDKSEKIVLPRNYSNVSVLWKFHAIWHGLQYLQIVLFEIIKHFLMSAGSALAARTTNLLFHPLYIHLVLCKRSLNWKTDGTTVSGGSTAFFFSPLPLGGI